MRFFLTYGARKVHLAYKSPTVAGLLFYLLNNLYFIGFIQAIIFAVLAMLAFSSFTRAEAH
ncbi:MAG: hypothetical protein A3C06_01185 [Candidatus Taylorbacteria bacterium RIFCSPHIGHO2_02_FULL_46_13]|uniref:Uncharacterized protein n=1 Tax=Candidatus Taylorbacteria bacterium RIFCSPHIGHO2_02_FULL_46_13 TaxID=1802312 RepID=A0A1G2MTB5_9BACT|nr:MAG: hypothetical protein A3C06_01185 [Candidatus Taylorbacteria bacterium RIFCSPHIGHO2_02_FULL_46_13]